MLRFSDPSDTLLQVTKHVVILQSTKMMVPVLTSQADLQYLSPHQNAFKSRLTMPASRMVDTVQKE